MTIRTREALRLTVPGLRALHDLKAAQPQRYGKEELFGMFSAT